MTTEIQVFKETEYPILGSDVIDFREALEFNLQEDRSISARKILTTISMPTQGGTIFSYSTIDGDVNTKEITGIIIHVQPERAKFVGQFGENKMPECSSLDGIIGVGIPGGECANCPDNQFGANSSPKPCKEVKMIYMLTKDDVLPICIKCTAGSFAQWQNYKIGLMRKGLRYTDVETTITLEAAQNPNKIKYSKLVFKLTDKITDKAIISKIQKIKNEFMPLIARTTSEKHDTIEQEKYNEAA